MILVVYVFIFLYLWLCMHSLSTFSFHSCRQILFFFFLHLFIFRFWTSRRFFKLCYYKCKSFHSFLFCFNDVCTSSRFVLFLWCIHLWLFFFYNVGTASKATVSSWDHMYKQIVKQQKSSCLLCHARPPSPVLARYVVIAS